MASIAQNIEGYTKLNNLTIKELETILPQLQKFVGKRISISTGFSKTFHVEHYKPQNQYDLNVYISITGKNMWLNISTSIQITEYSCEYFKRQMFIGELTNEGILTNVLTFENLSERNNLNEVFNETEIKEKFLLLETLEKQTRLLKSSLSKFL